MITRQVSKRDFKNYLNKLKNFGIECKIHKAKKIYAIKGKRGELLFADDTPLFIIRSNKIIPFIGSLNLFNGLKKVYVDKGAVPYIANGAHIMRPGIVSWGEFKAGDLIVVYVEEYNSPIAIGEALKASSELYSIEKGKVIKNLHHVGDEFWKIALEKKHKI